MEFTEEMHRTLTETEARSKSNTHRLDELEPKIERLHEQQVELAVLKKDMDHVKVSVDEIKDNVKKIMERPGGWWDKLIAALIGGLAAYFLKKLGVF